VPAAPFAEPIPARMLNEFVYCPRLFYYEFVEGIFIESADTLRGKALHKRVDQGSGALQQPQPAPPHSQLKAPSGEALGAAGPPQPEDEETIHSRSVLLGSEKLGVIAKMDLVEAKLDGAGAVAAVCPVDYKAGKPRDGQDGATLWDADRIQLGLQCLVLRENGYRCQEGIIYYRGTRQRVHLALTPETEAWITSQIHAARACATGSIPPPLIDSPKCVRCSLASVCLPDETQMLATHPALEPPDANSSQTDRPADTQLQPKVRRIIAPRDDRRALYLNTPGLRVGCRDGVLRIKEARPPGKQAKWSPEAIPAEDSPAAPPEGERLVEEVRVMDICHLALFGNIQLSTQAIQLLCERDIPITYFSMGGWFYGITRGHSLKNVFTRIQQFSSAADPQACLRFARAFVRGKIHNQRVLLMRNFSSLPDPVKLRLRQARHDAMAATSIEALLGIEGAAAAEYFAQFPGLIRARPEDEDFLEGLDSPPKTGNEPSFQRFDFKGRNRRPPTDPVNALLSLAYSLLAKECTIAAASAGLDPYVGFYHQPRFGRPALALDIMEEFRPIIADSAVITAINNRFVNPSDFVMAGKAVNLHTTGRRQFIACFEQRINSMVEHTLFGYKVSYRRAIELQCRLLAKTLTGEIPEYSPFLRR
jgi:CRISPR-associated protein Cas1